MSDRNVYDLASEDTNLHKKSRNEYAGPCPRCGGTDRFVVRFDKNFDKVTESYRGGFMCRNCWDPNNPPIRPDRPRWGDLIDYYQHFKGMNFARAQRAALEHLTDVVNGAIERVATVASRKVPANMPPSDDWQERNDRHVKDAIARLWSQEGTPVLDYLHARGFKDETIKALKWGAIHTSDVTRAYLGRVEVDTWFVVIPWHIDAALWQVEMRDIRPDAEPRYRQFPGSGNGLYLADSVQKKRPTFVVEGAFDAAIVAQEAGDLVNVVATGSTGGAQISKWAMRLSRMPVCLLAQDNEQQGDQGTEYWVKALAHRSPLRWRPVAGKDANAMHLKRAGYVRSWVTAALEYWQEQQSQVEQQSASDQGEPVSSVLVAAQPVYVESLSQGEQQQSQDVSDQDQGEDLLCTLCGRGAQESDGFKFSPDGLPYCSPECEQSQGSRSALERFIVAAREHLPGWTIGEVEPRVQGETLASYLEQHGVYVPETRARPYKPVTLPALPRSQCAHLEPVSCALPGNGHASYIKRVRCSGVPGPSGWCREHEAIQTLLEMGARLNYPHVVVSEQHIIQEGVESWEEYAKTCMGRIPYVKAFKPVFAERPIRASLPFVKALIDQREPVHA